MSAIQRIFGAYEEVSGQQLNRTKTTLFFSKNVPQVMQNDIITMLGVPEVKQYEKYLGLPSFVGREIGRASCRERVCMLV